MSKFCFLKERISAIITLEYQLQISYFVENFLAMNKVNVALSGINRAIDDGISKDGACAELINMRVKNGSLEPVGKPIKKKSFTNGEPIFIHKNANYEHIITYDENNVLWYDSDRNGDDFVNQNVSLCNIDNITQLQSVGNTLIILTEDSMYYLLYTNGTYKLLGEKPPFPVINFSLNATENFKDTAICTLNKEEDIKDKAAIEVDFSDENITVVTNALNGTANELMSKAIDKGYIVFPTFVRYALKTYDERYILQSAPVLMAPSDAPIRSVDLVCSIENNSKFKWFSNQIQCNGYTLSYNSFDVEGLEDWKDIITGIDVFITKPITTVELGEPIEKFTITKRNTSVKVDLNYKSNDDLKEDFEEASVFYKIHSFEVKEKYDAGKIKEENLISNLEQKDTLDDDSFSHNTYTGKGYVYNSRLHLGGVKETLFEGFPMNLFGITQRLWWGQGESYLTSQMIGKITCQVFLNTEEGEKVVTWSGAITCWGLTPFLSYPDTRATRMVIRLTQGAEGYEKVYQKTFKLKAHDFLNLAYNFDQFTAITQSQLNETATALTAEDKVVYSGNKLKVSEAANPFVFPVNTTYTISQGEIMGMATATTALSSGQFGQFPLYVFTSEGIFALSAGDGDIAYASTHPVTRDSCSSPSSITSIDNAVVFATETGLMAISGSETEAISDAVEGWLPSFIGSSDTIINKIAAVSGQQDKLSTTEFVYYLEGANIGYVYEDKELIVSNPNYGYSYVYNSVSGEWHKISCCVKRFLNSYPECLAVLEDGALYDMHNHHRSTNDVLLLTKPIKFDTTDYKRILQAALRGVIKPSGSKLYYRGEEVMYQDNEIGVFSQCGFYVLGSNDAEHFVLLSGREKLTDIRDLITKMNKSKAYKYFMVALAGGVRTDVALNYIEFMVDATYSNRLR